MIPGSVVRITSAQVRTAPASPARPPMPGQTPSDADGRPGAVLAVTLEVEVSTIENGVAALAELQRRLR